MDSEAVKNLRRERGVGTNIFSSFPRLIVSIDWLKQARAMSLLDDRLAGADPTGYPRAFDLLVIDEVHGCAPFGRGKYATDSQRTRAIRKTEPHFEHRLFLSATPHKGYSESFTPLLELHAGDDEGLSETLTCDLPVGPCTSYRGPSHFRCLTRRIHPT